ncbi:MAG TPA: FtsX-like permease family protein [Clostridiales bacterium]|nr:FtsX-like permease family protein [Clostridiales bacterium]
MTSSLWKNTLREIWNTKARFLSIMAIIALGVGFFAGVKGTSPAMVATAEQYAMDQALMDVQLLSSVGFDDEDIKAIQNMPDIQTVNAGYVADVMVGADSGAKVYRIHSMAQDNSTINRLVVTDGRLPEKTGEIVIDDRDKDFSVGDTIKVNEKAGDADASTMLGTLEYTVVGKVESPMYVGMDRGTATIGSGKVSYFAYALRTDFSYERYTEVYVATKYSDKGISPFSDQYEDGIAQVKNQLKDLGADRINIFDSEILQPSREKLEEGIKEYNSKKLQAEQQLNDAEKQLADGKLEYENKIKEAQQALDDAQKQIEQGEGLLPYSMTTYYEEILQAQKKISDSETQLTLGKSQLQTAQNQYDTQVAQAQAQLTTAQTAYDQQYYEFYTYTKPQSEYKINTYENLVNKATVAITQIEERLKDVGGELSEYLLKQLDDTKLMLQGYYQQLEQGRQQLADGEEKLAQAKQQLEQGEIQLEQKKADGQQQLADAQNKIDTAQTALDEGKEQFETAKAKGRQQIDDAQVQLSQGKVQLEQGRITLEQSKEQGQQQLDDGQKQLEAARERAKTELDNAKEQINSAQAKLDALSNPQWIVSDRNDVSGFGSFYDDTQRVDAVAMVFPLFFLLVAVLVCLTTMTRLLEERRTEIGTLKALGYSPASITAKFMVYAVTAGLLGCVVGVCVGVPILPNVIYNAYRMMYTTPTLKVVIPWDYILIGMLSAVVCTGGVVLFVCRKSLRAFPAKLMRPKSPKPGKRILLERIPFIWSHLGFTSKVTARNLFRYKARFLMTVLGVAGCTALIVAAFGLKDSINTVIDKQFTDVFKYDGMIVPQTKGDASQLEELLSFVADYKGVENTVLFNYSINETKDSNGNKVELDVYVPESASAMKKTIDLHTRTTKEVVPLTDKGVVISEKLSNLLKLSVGDAITYTQDNGDYTATVTGICENYIGNCIFMTPDYYEQLYGDSLQFNLIMEASKAMTDDEQDAFANALLERDDVMAASFIGKSITAVKDMMNSLNIIVYVMIFCAGALAFVVLYNLTNINIAERTREIATIKVLGFYNREVSAYVYRENIVLTVVGIVAGLVIGTALSGFIVQTAEVDRVMFGRDIGVTTYLYAIGLTALFALLVNGFMYFKMKVISMVDSLKSIE